MPVPTINFTQSVLGFLQWQPWVFQPLALHSPTSWHISSVPPGVAFDTVTGRITGPATMPGVFVVQLIATNATGSSEPRQFTIGIEASGYVVPSNIIEVYIDITTKLVSLSSSLADLQAAGANASLAAASKDDKEAKKVNPLFWVKAGDDLIFNVRFVKGGVPADLALLGLKFALKEFEPETIIVEGGGLLTLIPKVVAKIGSGVDASYRLAVKVEGDPLRAALSNYEDDQSTQFPALGEFEWTETNNYTPKVGPDTLRGTSRTFGVIVPRDLIPN